MLQQCIGFHSDLKMQLAELEQQISSKLELTNEMSSLLVQRASRIEELENMVASFDLTSTLSHQVSGYLDKNDITVFFRRNS